MPGKVIAAWPAKLVILAGITVLAIAGCGGKNMQQVKGTVTLDDGTPVSKAMVSFERKEGDRVYLSRAETQDDGSYVVSTKTRGDGAPSGVYRVYLTPFDVPRPPGQDIPGKYRSADTSELQVEVKQEPVTFDIKLQRGGKKVG